jgi:hypothetical protein
MAEFKYREDFSRRGDWAALELQPAVK